MTPQQAKAFMDGVPMPLVFIDQNERIVAANLNATDVFGAVESDRHYTTFLRHPAIATCVEAALAQNSVQDAQFLARDAVREFTFHVQATPVETLDQRGVLLSFEDRSPLHDAGQMRRDFVANVSHELRTPLTAVIGLIETLQGPARGDEKAQAHFLTVMDREAQRMSRLIHDLLSLSRLESEERMRPTELVDLGAVLASSISTLQPQAGTEKHRIEVFGLQDTVTIPGDLDQLIQVFTNLIENAVKYGRESVKIAVSKQSRDPQLRQATVTIEVSDDGDGIDPMHLPRLTERFYRVDNHRSREIGGTGLGLAIVKHIVNRHRGRLQITSTLGQGSQFKVILPSAL